MPGSKSSKAILRALATKHPEVEESIACKGTAVESSAFKVDKKTFLFARDVQMMVKLEESLPEAKELAAREPERYKAGGGWVTVKFDGGVLPPRELLARWIAESYRLMTAPAAKPKAAKRRR